MVPSLLEEIGEERDGFLEALVYESTDNSTSKKMVDMVLREMVELVKGGWLVHGEEFCFCKLEQLKQ